MKKGLAIIFLMILTQSFANSFSSTLTYCVPPCVSTIVVVGPEQKPVFQILEPIDKTISLPLFRNEKKTVEFKVMNQYYSSTKIWPVINDSNSIKVFEAINENYFFKAGETKTIKLDVQATYKTKNHETLKVVFTNGIYSEERTIKIFLVEETAIESLTILGLNSTNSIVLILIILAIIACMVYWGYRKEKEKVKQNE